jgi:transposase-like protein
MCESFANEKGNWVIRGSWMRFSSQSMAYVIISRRAVDQDDDAIDILVQKRRNKRATKRFFRKLM